MYGLEQNKTQETTQIGLKKTLESPSVLADYLTDKRKKFMNEKPCDTE